MSKKQKTCYRCSECGHAHSRWQGSCDDCFARNTLQEEIQISGKKNSKAHPIREARSVQDVAVEIEEARLSTGIPAVDQVLGGGIVQASLVLIGGEPGIGKSTLILQICKSLIEKKRKVFYVSGEESETQVKLRASRLGLQEGELYLLSENNLESVLTECERLNPVLFIVDSIQTLKTGDLDSSPGTVSQVRECTLKIMEFCKTRGVASLIVGHVTKGGELAGPRLLEHMVDVVLQFEGDKNHWFRILRGIKNRYGATDEVGVFEMKGAGLLPVENPSSAFLDNQHDVAGSALSVVMEGSQPFLVEVQALVADNHFTYPKRTAMGLDLNRLQILLAILEKRLGLNIGDLDVFVNLAGGVKTKDPALDLAILGAILSSFQSVPLKKGLLLLGEVGLGGEVRMVSRLDLRLREGRKQGFSEFFVPERGVKSLEKGEDRAGCRFLKDITSLSSILNS